MTLNSPRTRPGSGSTRSWRRADQFSRVQIRRDPRRAGDVSGRPAKPSPRRMWRSDPRPGARARGGGRAGARGDPLDVLFENDDLAAIDKPAGMVVHPAYGHRSGTLVNAVLARWPRSRLGASRGADRPPAGQGNVGRNRWPRRRLPGDAALNSKSGPSRSAIWRWLKGHPTRRTASSMLPSGAIPTSASAWPWPTGAGRHQVSRDRAVRRIQPHRSVS